MADVGLCPARDISVIRLAGSKKHPAEPPGVRARSCALSELFTSFLFLFLIIPFLYPEYTCALSQTPYNFGCIQAYIPFIERNCVVRARCCALAVRGLTIPFQANASGKLAINQLEGLALPQNYICTDR